MRIVIVGGGLVGLTLAALLRRRGVEPVVIERMAPREYVRRGFMLGHQGYDALADLGIASTSATGSRLERHDVCGAWMPRSRTTCALPKRHPGWPTNGHRATR